MNTLRTMLLAITLGATLTAPTFAMEVDMEGVEMGGEVKAADAVDLSKAYLAKNNHWYVPGHFGCVPTADVLAARFGAASTADDFNPEDFVKEGMGVFTYEKDSRGRTQMRCDGRLVKKSLEEKYADLIKKTAVFKAALDAVNAKKDAGEATIDDAENLVVQANALESAISDVESEIGSTSGDDSDSDGMDFDAPMTPPVSASVGSSAVTQAPSSAPAGLVAGAIQAGKELLQSPLVQSAKKAVQERAASMFSWFTGRK